MTDCLTQTNSNETLDSSSVRTGMESVPQQSPTAQLLIGQQVSPIVNSIDVSQSNPNGVNDSLSSLSSLSSVSGCGVSMSATIISSNASEPQNAMTSMPNLSVTSTSMASSAVSSGMSSQGSILTPSSQSQQLIVSSSQPQLTPTSQAAHLNASNALMAQSLGATITSVANHMATQQSTHNQMQPLLQTTVQPSAANQMSVAMSQLPQVQIIQQPMGGTGTYQFQQVYPQLLPGNLTIQNMPFGAHNQGLSLQIPFTGTAGVSTGTMPITSIAAKPPIMSKGVAISPLTQSQHHMISNLKQNIGNIGNIGPQSAQHLIKQVLPAQQWQHSNANQTVVISQLLHQNQHPMQQSILPNNTNRTLLEGPKGKPFGTGTVRSAFGNKMLSHSGAIQPKSPILPATSISSPLLANSQFKSPFAGNGNTTQLIATQTPSNLITNSQFLGSFQTLPQGLTWTTNPQTGHLMAQNGSPIFIRGPAQGGEQMYIQTSNMSSPQIHTVSMGSMGAPINVHNSGTAMQVNAAQSQSAPMTPIAASLQPISVASNANTTTTQVVNTSQPTAIVQTSIAPSANKARIVRQASSVATQTAAPALAQKQHVESTSTLKPIAPAKPKPSPQPITPNSKTANKETNPTPVRTTSVGTTQTVSQPTHPTNKAISSQPTPSSNKSDAANQTIKISVATETPKPNSQVTSSRPTTDQQNKLKSNSSTNTSADLTQSQPKVNSISEEVKTPTKRAVVEKKDASTEQDSDLMANFYAQHNTKSVQNAIQTAPKLSNNVSQQNGQQIPVLSDLNRQDISKQPQKAIVKPQILTHVIDGYIIQESPNPFPVNGLTNCSEPKGLTEERTNNNIIPIEMIKSKNKNENSLNSSASSSRNRTNSNHLCLNCGSKRKTNKNSRNPKRFCSQLCSEKFNSNNSDKNGVNCVPTPRLALYNSVTDHLDSDPQRGQDLAQELTANEVEKQALEERKKSKSLKRSHDNSTDSNCIKNGEIGVSTEKRKPFENSDAGNDRAMPAVNSVAPNASSIVSVSAIPAEDPTSCAIAGLYIPPGGRNPLQWSVNDVYEFVRNLQGCTEYADEFRNQEIDGQALMLIKEDHLMNSMSMKLGPALKICSKINALRDDVQRQT